MNDTFVRKVRSPPVAGWWVILVAGGLLLLQWFVYLGVTSAQPAWILALWGQDVRWPFVQNLWVWVMVVFKICVWLLALVVLWLTLCARQLRKQSGGA
jgi:hypothetical protein